MESREHHNETSKNGRQEENEIKTKICDKFYNKAVNGNANIMYYGVNENNCILKTKKMWGKWNDAEEDHVESCLLDCHFRTTM